MDEYIIFNKRYVPCVEFDANKNPSVRRFSLEEVQKIVDEENKRNGEDLYFYMNMEEWMKIVDSARFHEVCAQMDMKIEEIMNSPEIIETRKHLCEEHDKSINGFMLPFKAKNNEDYEIKLNAKLKKFISEINRPAFRNDGILVDDVEEICKNVINALEAAKTGNNEEAEKILQKILEEYKKNFFAVSELDKSYAFRGIAPFDNLKPQGASKEIYENMMDGELNFFRARVINKNEEIQNKGEINYLPYSKRNLAKDMRFSSNGKVCLYLGVTSYVCSKECRWNGEDNLYLASFKFNEKGKKLKIFNLIASEALLNGLSNNIEKSDKELYKAMIKVFPLVIATMFTISTPDEERKKKYGETIKEEYLLSQILMNVLQKSGIDGVAYLSRQGKDDFDYPQLVCLAIPITDNSENNEYGKLIEDFEMTSPILYGKFENNSTYERGSYINEKWSISGKESWEKDGCNAKIDYNGKTEFYQNTQFSKFDDFLVNQIHNEFVVS